MNAIYKAFDADKHKPVSAKMGLKPGMRATFIDAPADAIQAIDPPELIPATDPGSGFDYIHFFVQDQAGFHKRFPVLKRNLKPGGMLWVSWPKSGRRGTDLTLKSVIKIGYDYGLVESKCLSINQVWSALKFTHPKRGKIYQNSYGKLKQ